MNASPKLSVVVPVYQEENYLNQCIDSILDQTFPEFELLLINDGSKDRSGEICDSYAAQDLRVRVFHKENGGVSSARNLGLKEAKGDWITFIDSDDWVEKEYLFNLMTYRDYDLVVCSYHKFGGLKLENSPSYPDISYKGRTCIGEKMETYFDCATFGALWCKLFKTSILISNRIYFDPKISSGEDTLWVFQYFFFINSLKTISFAGYNYRQSENNHLSHLALSHEAVNYTLPKLITRLRHLEERFEADLSFLRYGLIVEMLHKHMKLFFGLNINEIKINMANLTTPLFSLLWRDREYVLKGERRKLFDWLILHRQFLLLAIYIKMIQKVY